MPFSLLGALCFLIWLGWRRFRRRTRPGRNGQYVLVDHEDGWLAIAHAGLGAVAATAFFGGVFWLSLGNAERPQELLFGAVDLVVWALALAWWLGVSLRDHRAGAPGELRLPAPTLQAGHPVAVTYLRRLKRHDSLAGEVHAELVLYHTERHDGQTRRERCEVIPLGAGGATLERGAIRAAWTFVVPPPLGREGGGGAFDQVIELVNAYEWVLEVHTPLGRLGEAGSNFPLPVVAGAAAAAAAGAVRQAG